MGKINRSFLKKFNIALVVLLGFLGFSSCSSLGRRNASTLENAERAQKDTIFEIPKFEMPEIIRPVPLYGIIPIDFMFKEAVAPSED